MALGRSKIYIIYIPFGNLKLKLRKPHCNNIKNDIDIESKNQLIIYQKKLMKPEEGGSSVGSSEPSSFPLPDSG